MLKYGPRNRSVGWPQSRAYRPATIPPIAQVAQNGRPNVMASRAATKPPVPNIAA